VVSTARGIDSGAGWKFSMGGVRWAGRLAKERVFGRLRTEFDQSFLHLMERMGPYPLASLTGQSRREFYGHEKKNPAGGRVLTGKRCFGMAMGTRMWRCVTFNGTMAVQTRRACSGCRWECFWHDADWRGFGYGTIFHVPSRLARLRTFYSFTGGT